MPLNILRKTKEEHNVYSRDVPKESIFQTIILIFILLVEEKTLKATFNDIRMGMYNGVFSPQVLDSAPGPDL